MSVHSLVHSPSIHRWVHPSVYPPAHPSSNPSSLHPSILLSAQPSSTCLSIHWCFYPSISPSIIHHSVCPSIHLLKSQWFAGIFTAKLFEDFPPQRQTVPQQTSTSSTASSATTTDQNWKWKPSLRAKQLLLPTVTRSNWDHWFSLGCFSIFSTCYSSNFIFTGTK